MSIEVTFRTLKGGTFKLPTQPTDTILDIKKKVAAEQSVEDYGAYRLIYKGKILADDATVSAAGISSTGFIVVMPPKKKVAPKPVPKPVEQPIKPHSPSPAPAPDPAPADPPAESSAPAPSPATAPAQPAAAPSAAAATAAATAAAPPDPSNLLVTGETYEQSVKQISAMGFPEDEVKKALQAAFNNPDRAVEFLVNGMPEMPPVPPASASTPAPPNSMDQAPPSQPSTTPRSTQTAAVPGTPFNMFETPAAGADDAAAGRGSLDFLRSIPQFNNMRRLIRANPSVLQQMLQQLEQSNPDLLQIIDANQAEFTRLINEPIAEGESAGDDVVEQIAQGMAGAGEMGTVQRGNELYVTPEDHEKINRLTELAATIGLQQAHVLQTWVACNGDETLAANYLVDHAEELRADLLEEEDASNQQERPGAGDGGPPV